MFFIAIDDWFFDKVFQRVADWFNDRFGRGPYWLASTLVYFFMAIFAMRAYFADRTVSSIFFDGLFYAFFLYVAWHYDKVDERLRSKLTPTMNSARISTVSRVIRLLCLNAVIMSVGKIVAAYFYMKPMLMRFSLTLVQDIVFVAIMYFTACETKPPKPKPAKKGVEVPDALPDTV